MTQLQVTVRDYEVRTLNQRLRLSIQKLPNGVMRPILDIARKEASGGYSGGNSYAVGETGGGYVRTGNYGSSTTLEYLGGQSYRIEQGASYSRYVGGYADGSGQARVHVGRWPLLRDVMEKAVEAILEAIEAEFQRQIGIDY
jgi:hypothetical protein